MTASIAARLKVAILVVIIFLITISIVLFCYFFKKTLYKNEAQTMESIGTLTSYEISKSMSVGDYINVDNVINKTLFPDFIQGIKIININEKQIVNVTNTKSQCSNTHLYDFLIKSNTKNVTDNDISNIGKIRFVVERCAIQKKITNIIVLVMVISFVLFGFLFLLIPKIIHVTLNPLLQSISRIQSGSFPQMLFLEKAPAEIKPLLISLKEVYEKAADLEIYKEQVKITKQISHDIRSPLAALKVVRDMGASNLDPDQAKLLTMSIDRITDIANTILPKNFHSNDSKEVAQSSFLWMLVDQIISEKRVEYKSSNDISIDFQTEASPFELNAFCNATEFMRSISNIINNSIEAKNPNKKLDILVRLNLVNDSVVLNIIDNGKGMSSEVLSKAVFEGFTHGKFQGTGLGLYQVKKAIESWNGKINIESQPNIGTSIMIALKKSPKPKWLASSIQISSYQSMIVLDDEEYVFSILQDRFDKYFKDIRYFKRIDEFEKQIVSDKSFLFIDHDLKQNMSGIDLIQKYNLQERSVLLTGNYDDKQVQQRASELGIKILPKPLIHDLPIVT